MLRRTASLAFLAVLIVGCKSQGPKIPSMTGSWTGTLLTATLNVTLSEQDKSITGAGMMQVDTFSLALNVTGTHAHPTVSLTLSAQGYESMNFTGSFGNDDNSISGTVNGSGFVNQALTLLRR